MDELGYVPNMTARNLGKRISSAIGVILPPLDSKSGSVTHFILRSWKQSTKKRGIMI